MTSKRVVQTTSLLICMVYQVYSGERSKQVWDHHETLDNEGKYQLYWSADKNIVTFQAEVMTEGWVGFAIAPDMNFEGSDLIIGGVKNNKEYIAGYHVNKHGKLQPSTKYWTMMSASENKGRTVLKFRAKLHACNPESWVIPGETHSIFYAYSHEDFTSLDKIRLNDKNWMMIMLKLLQPRVNQIEMPEDVKYFDFRMGNYSVPGNLNSLYGCITLKGPELSKKHHIIKISPIVQPDNIEIVHHLTLVKCTVSNAEGEEMISEGSNECIYGDSFLMTGKCVTIIFDWGRGGGSFLYPTKAGLPFGENPNEYYMLQIHYDNPSFLNGIIDNSGVRVYYTQKLREYDAGTLGVGVNIMSRLVIPPGQRQFIVAGHAHPNCFTETINGEIRIYAVLLHAHLLGRKLKLLHFRNGKELRPVAMDNHFNHHYQKYTYLSENAVLLPGDQLTVECIFDSTSRNVTAFGRERTADEMCAFGVYYYPKISLYIALSDINPALIAGLTGMDLTGGSHSYSGALTSLAEYDRYLLNYDWPQERICLIQNAQRYAPQDTYCQTNDTRVIRPPSITYPEGFKPYRIPSACSKSSTDEDECSRYM